MASLVQDIQAVRSLRKDIRDVRLPANILNSIETIHNCIKSGTDLNGWKRVDWRGAPKTQGAGGATGGGGAGGGRNGCGHGFFGNRNSNQDHYAFGSRAKSSRPSGGDAPISIPLTGGTESHNKSAQLAPAVSADGFRTVSQKYVSKFKKGSDNVDDKILNTILLGKLNKFSELNYNEIKEFITHIIDSGQTEMIKCFMKLVFEKAASEEMFCPLYARLLSELSIRYPVLLTEMSNLYAVYMEIFDEVQEENAENYNEVCKRNIEKKYRRGYSQFLAELIKHNVINNDIFMKTITKIIAQVEMNMKSRDSLKLNEEYADCLMKIMKAIKPDTTVNKIDSDSDEDNDEEKDSSKIDVDTSKLDAIRQVLKVEMSARFQPLTMRNSENVGISNKARFALLDIYESIQKF